MVLKGYDSTDGCDGKVDLLVFLEQEASYLRTNKIFVSKADAAPHTIDE